MATEPAGQISELRHEIALHNAAYHGKAAPEISDYDYDLLKRKLAALEREFPDAAQAAAPLPEIGDDRSGLARTYRHRERMLSLEKVYTEAELRAFDARVAKLTGRTDLAYVVEPKFDGLAVSVTFEHGKLIRAITRGNGNEGDDVTAHARLIPGIPAELRGPGLPSLIEARGEIYVPFTTFARVNAEREAAGESLFANPRNLAAGTLRQLDPRESVRRGLRVVFFGIGACEPLAILPKTQHELAARFQVWGLPAIERSWRAHSADELVSAVEACHRSRTGFGYPTDGAVAKVDSLALQRELGTGESAPRWAIAFKFPPERVETEVLAITVQVGRSGVLTPVAELAPVQLAGSTIARATLHNRDEIARRDIRIGDTVWIEKAGEIIPAVVGVNLERRPATAQPFVFPGECPGCRAAIVERKGEVALRCGNSECAAQLRRRVEHFASRDAVGIAGLGPALIDVLVEKKLIRELPDIYRLSRGEFFTLGKNNARSAEQVLTAIESSKQAELWRVIYGLGIPQVGAVAARDLARRFGSLEAMVSRAPGIEDSVETPVRALQAFLTVPKNRTLIDELIAVGVRPKGPVVVAGKSGIAGKVFVLTGTLPTLTRARATEQIQAAGGKVGSSVSRATHVVVAGSEPGAKLEQARALGITVIDEPALLRMLSHE